MCVLVTGGVGFIGGHHAEAVVRGGHTVTVLDHLDPDDSLGIEQHTNEGATQVADESDDSYGFVDGRVTDAELVSRCRNGEPPEGYGTGKQTRDCTSIDDDQTCSTRTGVREFLARYDEHCERYEPLVGSS